MFTEHLFQISIVVSLAVHGLILYQNPNFRLFSSAKTEKPLEITYVKTQQETKTAIKSALFKREPLLKLSPNLTVEKGLPPPFVGDPVTPDFAKPAFAKSDYLALKKTIILPPINLDKISNPSYTNYYQLMREKIKRATYQNYGSTETGEVTVSFVISSDGYLKDLQLADDNSSISPALKEIALRSVREASPFPNFPKELDYQQLPFKLTIIFQVE